MGRTPCCSKVGMRRGVWTALEDEILTNYIKIHGEGRWRSVSKEAGLKRCGKSCRLRWINYLRPDIKRGNISPEEQDLILKLHGLLGNRWSLIAGRLPGRTDNEIKNYWNTNLRKKVNDGNKQSDKLKDDEEKPIDTLAEIPSSNMVTPNVIRPKAFKCTKVLITTPQPYKVDSLNTTMVDAAEYSSMNQEYLVNNATLLMESKSSDLGAENSSNFSSVEFNVRELLASNNEYLSDQSGHFWEGSEFDNVIEKNGNNIDGTNDEPWPSWDLCNFENVVEEEGNNNAGHGGVNHDDRRPPSFDNYLLFLDEILQD